MKVKFNININNSHTLFNFLASAENTNVYQVDYNKYLNELMVWFETCKNEEDFIAAVEEFAEHNNTHDFEGSVIIFRDGHSHTF